MLHTSGSYHLWHLQGYVLQMIYFLAPVIYRGHTFSVLQHNLWADTACASRHTCKAHSTCYICTACSFGYTNNMPQIPLMHIQHHISSWNIVVLEGNEQTQEANTYGETGEQNQTRWRNDGGNSTRDTNHSADSPNGRTWQRMIDNAKIMLSFKYWFGNRLSCFMCVDINLFSHNLGECF